MRAVFAVASHLVQVRARMVAPVKPDVNYGGFMRKTLVLSALASLALAGPAMADTFSYSYLEGGLFGDSIDDPDGNANDLKGGGLGLNASWAINRALFGFANLNGTEYEYRRAPTDEDDFSAGRLGLGLGVHFPIGRRVDVVTGFSLQRLRLENDFYDTTLNEDGWGMDIGLRGMIGERLQWTVAWHNVDYGRDNEDSSWSTGFRYYFTRTFAMGIDFASTDENQASGLIAFRWDVGNR
jgi:hypothetical protein